MNAINLSREVADVQNLILDSRPDVEAVRQIGQD